MPDPDSRPLTASLNDLRIMSCLHLTPLFEGVAHRFADYCNEFGLAIGFRATFDAAEAVLGFGFPEVPEAVVDFSEKAM